MTKSVYCFGVGLMLDSRLAGTLPEVHPDGRLKDPLKIEISIKERLEARAGVIRLSPLLGMVRNIVFGESEDMKFHLITVDEENNTATENLSEYARLSSFLNTLADDENGVILAGVDASKTMMLLGTQMSASGYPVHPDIVYGSHERYFDPVSKLTGCGYDTYLDTSYLTKRLDPDGSLGLSIPEDYVFHENFWDDYTIVAELCVRYNLLPWFYSVARTPVESETLPD